jgi:hypothetical protein
MGGFGVSGSPRLLRRGRARTHGKVAPAPDTSRFGREFSTISCVSTRSCEVRRLSTTSLAGILDIFTCALQGSWVGLHPSGFENRHCNVDGQGQKDKPAQTRRNFKLSCNPGGAPATVASQSRHKTAACGTSSDVQPAVAGRVRAYVDDLVLASMRFKFDRTTSTSAIA